MPGSGTIQFRDRGSDGDRVIVPLVDRNATVGDRERDRDALGLYPDTEDCAAHRYRSPTVGAGLRARCDGSPAGDQ